MRISSASHPGGRNKILAALPGQQYARLHPHLEQVYLARSKIIYDLGEPVYHAYFLLGGMVSLLAITEDGSTVEVAMTGYEGVLGIPALLNVNKAPYRTMVQIPGKALRIRAEALRSEFDRSGPLRGIILSYMHTVLSQVAQSAACNRFHTLEERLCRWLLISHDHVNTDVLHLTQEALSHMLGASRTNVTTTAGLLKRANLISYRRGRISILDRPGLESSACECYRIVARQLRDLKAA